MKINELILCIYNDKGYEKNFVCTFDNFAKTYISKYCDNFYEAAEVVRELERVKDKDNGCAEMYVAANKTMYMRYCKSVSDLELFIKCRYNENESEFAYDYCDDESKKMLEKCELVENGVVTNRYPLHYEKLKKNFKQGEVLHNLNGCDYKVLELLSDRNLLLLNLDSGTFTVGIGVDYYGRYPRNEDINSEACEMGIEWGHGVYLGNIPSVIDFKIIREKYGRNSQMDENKSNDKRTYQVEVEEKLARTIDVEADSMEEAVDIISDRYYGEEIVLDAEDMKETNFKVMGSRELTREKTR